MSATAVPAAEIAGVAFGLPDTELTVRSIARIGRFSLVAGATAAAVAVVFRWYSDEAVPDGMAILAGISTVALWLNTKRALGDAIVGETSLVDPTTAVFTVSAFAASAIASDGGRRLGDHLAREVFNAATPRSVDDVTDLVRSAGRVVGVDLPETIADLEGYDPVDDETKAELSGRTMFFPRRLGPEGLEARVAARLERDFGVGHVAVDVDADGTVTSLALGSRPAGIGPTLAPDSVAVAIRADPSPDASPGDAVEVWVADEVASDVGADAGDADVDDVDAGSGNGDAEPRRLTGAELRSTAGDVVTLAVDADDADALAADRTYRLVTLPGSAGITRELVTLFRAADETVTAEPIETGSPLEGEAVGSLPVAVLVIERGDDAVPLPDAGVELEAGDVAYVLGTPTALRRLDERKRTRSAERRRERTRGSGGRDPTAVSSTEADARSGTGANPGSDAHAGDETSTRSSPERGS